MVDDNNQKQLFYQKELLEEVKKSYVDMKLIPFIGAGFSENIKGYPNWDEFIKILQVDLNIDEVHFFKKNFDNDFLEATEYYIIKKGEYLKHVLREGEDLFDKGREELRKLIEVQFKGKNYDDDKWVTHKKLIEAKDFGIIFTTNWDDTLEKTCEALGKSYTKIVIERNLRDYLKMYLKNHMHKQIIKLHGDYERTDSIIACETDYYKRITELSALDIKFMNDLLHYDFIFLGYSFRDINIKYIFHQMYTILSRIPNESKPNIYFVSL
ncbi:unnamed protein product, partial [marine sediment metagenome]